jgi:hypothetical protein
VVVVEGGRVGLVAEFDEQLADGEVAERGGQVQVRVGVAREREVWVVEQVRVRLEDAPGQQRVIGVDRAPQPDGRVDPVGMLSVYVLPALPLLAPTHIAVLCCCRHVEMD